jgi:hypothetical protein
LCGWISFEQFCAFLHFGPYVCVITVRSLRGEVDRRPGRPEDLGGLPERLEDLEGLLRRPEDPEGRIGRPEASRDPGRLQRTTRFTPIYDLNTYQALLARFAIVLLYVEMNLHSLLVLPYSLYSYFTMLNG